MIDKPVAKALRKIVDNHKNEDAMKAVHDKMQ